jgi:hypothetical protein
MIEFPSQKNIEMKIIKSIKVVVKVKNSKSISLKKVYQLRKEKTHNNFLSRNEKDRHRKRSLNKTIKKINTLIRSK